MSDEYSRGYQDALLFAVMVVEQQELFHDTKEGIRQRWVKDQISQKLTNAYNERASAADVVLRDQQQKICHNCFAAIERDADVCRQCGRGQAQIR